MGHGTDGTKGTDGTDGTGGDIWEQSGPGTDGTKTRTDGTWDRRVQMETDTREQTADTGIEHQ